MGDEPLRVGFIGMGIMGAPMAENCLKAGFPVTVWNRTAAKCEPLCDAGAERADSPADLAARSDVVLVCVTGADDVLEVVLDGEAPVIDGIRDGATVVDHSTVSPDVAERCAAALGERGAGFLDAPVSGGDTGAREGALSIMVGGEKAHFDRVRGVLEAMGKTITHCGPAGSGYVVKLCNQVLVSLNCLAAAEAITLAEACGVDVQAMLQAVSGGAAGSWQLTKLAPKMVAGDFAPGFFVDYLLKDLDMAHAAAHQARAPLPGASVAETMFRAAGALGAGRDGTQAVYKALRALRGE